MGKIFGISDLPVSTIVTPFEQLHKSIAPKPTEIKRLFQQGDKFISEKTSNNSMQIAKKNTQKYVKVK